MVFIVEPHLIGEVRYITVEAIERGEAEISLKGKIRTVLLPGKLCHKLIKYAQRQGITKGELYSTEPVGTL